MKKYILIILIAFSANLFGQISFTSTKTWSAASVTVDAVSQCGVSLPSVSFAASDFGGCSGSTYSVTDVNVFVGWCKQSGTCAAPDTGNPFHAETSFCVNSPSTNTTLATSGTWSGSTALTQRMDTWFDQAAGSVPFGMPSDGTYLPNGGDLNTFNGTSPIGSWLVRAGDTGGGDPLCVNEYQIQVTATVIPPGNPATFGSNEWLVYAYSGTDYDLGGGVTYYGNYTEPLLSFDSRNRWGTNDSPANASGYQGCDPGVDNHTVVSKRQGFPCEVYIVDVPNHDDGAKLFINGVQVFQDVGCCTSHLNVWTGVLGATDQVDFRHQEGGGGSHQGLTFNIITAALNAGTITAPVTITNCGTFTPGTMGSGSAASGGASASITNGGTTAYQWQLNGVDIGGATNVIYSPPSLSFGVYNYTRVATDKCGSTATSNTVTFTVNTNPTVTFTAPTDLCLDAGNQTNQTGGSPTGGLYSGPGVTDTGDGINYSFDPAAAGVGTHTITYNFTDGNGCAGSANDAVVVFGLPTVTFTALAGLCLNAGVQAGLGNGTPTGGFYSGPGVTDTGDGINYSFDPAAAGVGTHTITYNFTDGNSCSGSANDNVIISACITFDWVGTTDTDWNTASNWSGNAVPSSTDLVTIPDVSSGSGNFPLITPSVILGDITVDANSSLVVATGIVLDGTFTNNGTVTLQDGAYLDDFINVGASFVGEITVETMAANGVTDDQRFITSPVNAPMFSEIADDLNGPWGAGAQGTNGVAVTVDDCSIPTLTAASNYGNLFELNESIITNGAQCELEAWVVRSSGQLDNARGYSAYLTNGSTFNFSGTPNTGAIQINATNSSSSHVIAEGWNLLGNPYPSPISRNAVITAGATDVQYFVTSGVYQGAYSAYNPGSNIAIAQGFQAHVNTTGNINFDNSMRNTGVSTWYATNNWFEYKLEISVFGANSADKTTLFYNNDATNGYEPMFDVQKRKSNPGHPTLSTFGVNKDLTLNGMSINDLGETVPMNLDAGANGTFTLSFAGKETFPANTTIYVKDLQEDIVHNIANGDYIFMASTTDNKDRFEIIFIPEISFLTTNVDCDGNEGSVQLLNTNYINNRTFDIVSDNGLISSNDLVNLNESLIAGSYSLNVNDQYGGMQAYLVEIESADIIEATFTVSSTTLFVGEMLLLDNTTSNSNSVDWSIGNSIISNVNNATYSFKGAGLYEIEMNVSNSECADLKTETVTVVNKTTGIETIEGEDITFYPNPVTDILYINATKYITIEIVDILGKTVVKTSNKTINLENVSVGMYIIQVYDTNNSLIGTEKLIKK
jgi:hypothetical protein